MILRVTDLLFFHLFKCSYFFYFKKYLTHYIPFMLSVIEPNGRASGQCRNIQQFIIRNIFTKVNVQVVGGLGTNIDGTMYKWSESGRMAIQEVRGNRVLLGYFQNLGKS